MSFLRFRLILYVIPLAMLAYASLIVLNSIDSLRTQVAGSYSLSSSYSEGQRLEMELLRFKQTLASYIFSKGKHHDDVLMDFDIFWNRTHVLSGGKAYAEIRSVYEKTKLLEATRSQLKAIDALLTDLKPRDVATYTKILKLTETFSFPMVEATNTMVQNRMLRSIELRKRLDAMVGQLDSISTKFMVAVAVVMLLFMLEAWNARKAERQVRVREEHVRFLAETDTLTKLGNRAYLNKKLADIIHEIEGSDEVFHLMLLDLDGFKDVNDSFGHPVGDALLCAVAGRLRGRVRQGDVIARLGGDEFAVIIRGNQSEVLGIGQRIIDGLNESFSIEGRSIHISTSIGLTSSDDDELDAAILMRNADLALYEAKAAGRNTMRTFEANMIADILYRKGLEVDLRQALASQDDQITVYYQPQVDLRYGDIIGVEALARWKHPEHGFVPPPDFIKIAEQAGIIHELSNWVMRMAARDIAQMRSCGFDIHLSVNLSPVQLISGALPLEIDSILSETGLQADNLTLEITESMMMHDRDCAMEVLTRLNTRGIALSVDDFGTGYSNLGYLKSFPLQFLKIDRSFVTQLESSSDDRMIVHGIINLARGLGLKVVAEGIETPGQADYLCELGCDEGQGYRYGRPVSVLKLISELDKKGRRVGQQPTYITYDDVCAA